MDEPYKNREIDEFKREMFTRLDIQDKTLNRIETQTIKTNGRVNGLETWSAETKELVERLMADNGRLKTDRTRIYTFLSILMLVMGTVGFLFYNLIDLKIQSSENTQIPIAVSNGIDDYFSSHFSKTQIINNNN